MSNFLHQIARVGCATTVEHWTTRLAPAPALICTVGIPAKHVRYIHFQCHNRTHFIGETFYILQSHSLMISQLKIMLQGIYTVLGDKYWLKDNCHFLW